jgi:hypothetical protein
VAAERDRSRLSVTQASRIGSDGSFGRWRPRLGRPEEITGYEGRVGPP